MDEKWKIKKKIFKAQPGFELATLGLIDTENMPIYSIKEIIKNLKVKILRKFFHCYIPYNKYDKC